VLLWRRELLLTLRDPEKLIGYLFMSIVAGVLLGVTYFGNGKAPPISQLGALATIQQTAFLSTYMTLSLEDDFKRIVKLEGADQLYSLALYAIVHSFMHFLYSSLTGIPFFLIAFAMLQLPWSYFGWYMIFGYLVKWALEAMFLAIPILGRDAGDGNTKFIILTLTAGYYYNGLSANSVNMPSWMQWALYTSPSYWAVEGLAVALYEGHPAGQELFDFYGFQTGRVWLAIAICVAYQVLFRTLYVWGFVYLWKPQK